MDRPWFDQETDVLLIDEYIVEMDSYQRIVGDGKITDTELLEQTLKVVTLLRQLEEALSPEAKALATETFGESASSSCLSSVTTLKVCSRSSVSVILPSWTILL